MNIYILSVIIISVLFIPVSFAAGEEILGPTLDDDQFQIYLFVQVIHRDSDGNLLAYFQSDKMTHLVPEVLEYYINAKSQTFDIPVRTINGVQVQLYGEKFTEIQDRTDLTASTLFVVASYAEDDVTEINKQLAARFPHDGLLLSPGDVVITVWNFAKFF
jgi:hypothetical protein